MTDVEKTKTSTVVVKIMPRADWLHASAEGTYSGSVHDARDGFIHLSTLKQLQGTLEKHYRGQDDLVAIAFSSTDLGAALKWEVSRGGNRFPHLYGALATGAAKLVVDVASDPGGIPQVPDALIDFVETTRGDL